MTTLLDLDWQAGHVHEQLHKAQHMAIAVTAVPTPLSTARLLLSASRCKSDISSVGKGKKYQHRKLVRPKLDQPDCMRCLCDVHIVL